MPMMSSNNNSKSVGEKNSLVIFVSDKFLIENNLTMNRLENAFNAYIDVCNEKVDKNLF